MMPSDAAPAGDAAAGQLQVDGPPAAPGPAAAAPPAARQSRLARLRALSRPAKIGVAAAAAVVLAAAGLLVSAAGGSPAKAGPPPAARAFSVPVLGSTTAKLSLAGYAGRPVIVNFFASWCGPCQKETPLLAGYYASHGGKVVILGIDANDEQAAAQKFVAAKDVRYPVGVDPFPSPVAISYGVNALPQTFFLNSRHQIVARVKGAVTAGVLARDVALMNRRPAARS